MSYKNKLTWVVLNSLVTGNYITSSTKGDYSISEEPDGTVNLPLYELIDYNNYNQNILNIYTGRIKILESSSVGAHTHNISDFFREDQVGFTIFSGDGGSSTSLSTTEHNHLDVYYTKETLKSDSGLIIHKDNIVGFGGKSLGGSIISFSTIKSQTINTLMTAPAPAPEWFEGASYRIASNVYVRPNTFVDVLSIDLKGIGMPCNASILTSLEIKDKSIPSYIDYQVLLLEDVKEQLLFEGNTEKGQLLTPFYFNSNQSLKLNLYKEYTLYSQDLYLKLLGWMEPRAKKDFHFDLGIEIKNDSGSNDGALRFTALDSTGVTTYANKTLTLTHRRAYGSLIVSVKGLDSVYTIEYNNKSVKVISNEEVSFLILFNSEMSLKVTAQNIEETLEIITFMTSKDYIPDSNAPMYLVPSIYEPHYSNTTYYMKLLLIGFYIQKYSFKKYNSSSYTRHYFLEEEKFSFHDGYFLKDNYSNYLKSMPEVKSNETHRVYMDYEDIYFNFKYNNILGKLNVYLNGKTLESYSSTSCTGFNVNHANVCQHVKLNIPIQKIQNAIHYFGYQSGDYIMLGLKYADSITYSYELRTVNDDVLRESGNVSQSSYVQVNVNRDTYYHLTLYNNYRQTTVKFNLKTNKSLDVINCFFNYYKESFGNIIPYATDTNTSSRYLHNTTKNSITTKLVGMSISNIDISLHHKPTETISTITGSSSSSSVLGEFTGLTPGYYGVEVRSKITGVCNFFHVNLQQNNFGSTLAPENDIEYDFINQSDLNYSDKYTFTHSGTYIED